MTTAITTREGIVVKAGQVWRDLDRRTQGPRGGERTGTITTVSARDGICIMSIDGAQPYRTTRIQIRRMHKGATGWALVSEVA